MERAKVDKACWGEAFAIAFIGGLAVLGASYGSLVGASMLAMFALLFVQAPVMRALERKGWRWLKWLLLLMWPTWALWVYSVLHGWSWNGFLSSIREPTKAVDLG